MLEHINKIDIPLVLSEFKRVASKKIFLLIAQREEINKKPVKFLQRQNFKIKNLHVTIENREWWSTQIEKSGIQILKYNILLGAHHFILNV